MDMLLRKFAVAAACLACGAAAAAESPLAPVATLSRADGVVMVNTGERFVNAIAGQALAPGDRIMVLSGAKAELRFADDCSMPLAANTVAVVPATSTCAGAVADVRSYGPMTAQAIGGSATTTEPVDDDECFGEGDEDGEESDCVGWWIAGGLLAGWAIWEAVDDDDRSPVSN